MICDPSVISTITKVGTIKDIKTLIDGGVEISAKLVKRVGQPKSPLSTNARVTLSKWMEKRTAERKAASEERARIRDGAVNTMMDILEPMGKFFINRSQIHINLDDDVNIRTIITSEENNVLLFVKSDDEDLNLMIMEPVNHLIDEHVDRMSNESELVARVEFDNLVEVMKIVVDSFVV